MVPPIVPPMHRMAIIIEYVLLMPNKAIETAIPRVPMSTTGFRPYLLEIYELGKTSGDKIRAAKDDAPGDVLAMMPVIWKMDSMKPV